MCGNGRLDPGEACDDGNAIDGDGCDHNCTATACGNGIVTPGEACDDGNAIDGDGCDHDCTATACGNGIVNAGEACDDGNAIDGDGCDHNCTVTACGNGIVTAGEACDDGNAITGDGCESCQFAACSSGAPVEPGNGGSLPLAGPIARIVASPANCFVYALSLGPPTQLVMFSTVSKQEVVRISLPGAKDLAISPDGTYLVAAQADAKQLGVIDPATGRVTRTVLTGEAPSIVQVDNNGVAYYGLVLEDGYPEITAIFRIGLLAGIETRVTTLDGADVTLSSDGNFLYAGESGTTGGNLFKYAVSAAGSTAVDRTTYNDSYGFLNTDRHTYLSPGGQHIYFAGFQLDAHALDFVTGRTGELIYAEDAAGSFAVGASHVFDAALVRPVAELPHGASAAALTANDRELWYYGAPGRLYYVNMSDLIGAALGLREVAPGPLGRYSFAKLIHDPVRPRLYGVDTAAAEVVVIDTTTLQPMRSIRVNTTPTDLAIDAAGTTLFVGHQDVQGFARIRLDDLTFERYVVAPRVTYQVAAVSNGRVVTIDEDQWTIPSLLDATTGAVLSEGSLAYDSALSATADGTTVFVGEADSTGGNATRYSLATGALIATGHTPHGFYFPARSIAALPDGTAVYYAGVLLDGNDLGVQRYTVNETVVAVSPDGRRALSSTTIYDVATGHRLGALPVTASALAISPDSKKAFLFTGSAILSVDLSAF